MIILMAGIPSSGKTTRAKMFAKEWNAIILSRDEIRAEFDSSRKGKFIGSLHFEEKITQIFNKRLCKYLSMGENIVIDNTNLRVKYIKEILAYVNHFGRIKETFIFFSPFTDDLNKCIELNKQRDPLEQVPEEAIHRFYEIYKSNKAEINKISTLLTIEDFDSINIQKPKYIPIYSNFDVEPYTEKGGEVVYICDIDGTLAEHNRDPYDYAKCKTDSVIYPMWQLLKLIDNEGITIILMSGRPEKDENGFDVRKATEEWLEEHNISYDHLFMRKEGDKRNDAIVKYELFNENIRNMHHEVLGVFDDRLRVINMWEELGVPVFNVNNGMGEY